ncbi:MAG: bifunctional folylpolyglutamate synthase/dihydrofolate synthase [Candidatus Marinimicrobia bacterium]|nr:bifunctional folylpolyglutamate synthase/dihydrofolate synthase [Candidatus Neomarinimicrobiota bacterium]
MIAEKLLARLYSLERKGIKLGLEPTRRLLARCGHPQHDFISIQIAGTNGKGSTAAITAAILQTHGQAAGLYTSPHLLRFNERIRVNGAIIPDEYIVSWMEQHSADIEAESSTFFETTTVMALCYFRDCGVAWAVLETGLGGRLDAVTAVESSWSVICPIAMDHVEILGSTLGAIATEKAGILRPGVPCFSAPQRAEALEVLTAKSEDVGAPLTIVDAQPGVPRPRHLFGAHQHSNAALAWEVTRAALGDDFSAETAGIALRQVTWPGRYQVLSESPRVIFDVAHNLHGMEALLVALGEEKSRGQRTAVLALQQDKGADELARLMAPSFDAIIVTQTGIRDFLPAGELLRNMAPFHSSVITHEDPAEAIGAAITAAKRDDLVVILGSHYLGPAVAGHFKISFDNI